MGGRKQIGRRMVTLIKPSKKANSQAKENDAARGKGFQLMSA
jgi:hypothetical protein